MAKRDDIYIHKLSETLRPNSPERLTSPAQRRRTPRWWCRTLGWSPWPRGSRQWWWSCSAPGLLCPTHRRHDLALLLAGWLIFTLSSSATLAWPCTAHMQVHNGKWGAMYIINLQLFIHMKRSDQIWAQVRTYISTSTFVLLVMRK